MSNDPMYYREKIAKLIKQAQENELEVYTKENLGEWWLYFEATNFERWAVLLPRKKEI